MNTLSRFTPVLCTLILFLCVTLLSCESDPELPAELPVIQTVAISDVSATSAKSGGIITTDGNRTITARGIVWSTAPNPDLSSTTKTSDEPGNGNYVSTMTGLTAGTKYYVRAYATNEVGTAYGNEVMFIPVVAITSLDDALVANMSTYHIPSLSIAIIKNGKLVYMKSYGVSDKEAESAASNTDRYRIGSLAKPITQAVILKLINEGSFTFDTKVFGDGGLLGTDFGTPSDPRMNQITIRHLLEHTSGWTNTPNDPMFVNVSWSRAEVIKDMLENRPLTNDPGTKPAYLNFGYSVLGRVIEKVTGQGYEEYVKSVLSTMGITDMQIAGNTLADRLPFEVKYYQAELDPYSLNVTRMDADAGWVATATDLAKFVTHVDRESTIKDIVPTNLLNETYFKYENWYHTGSLPGTSTVMSRLDDQFSFVVLANTRTHSNFDLVLNELFNTMKTQIEANKNWPVYNLF